MDPKSKGPDHRRFPKLKASIVWKVLCRVDELIARGLHDYEADDPDTVIERIRVLENIPDKDYLIHNLLGALKALVTDISDLYFSEELGPFLTANKLGTLDELHVTDFLKDDKSRNCVVTQNFKGLRAQMDLYIERPRLMLYDPNGEDSWYELPGSLFHSRFAAITIWVSFKPDLLRTKGRTAQILDFKRTSTAKLDNEVYDLQLAIYVAVARAALGHGRKAFLNMDTGIDSIEAGLVRLQDNILSEENLPRFADKLWNDPDTLLDSPGLGRRITATTQQNILAKAGRLLAILDAAEAAFTSGPHWTYSDYSLCPIWERGLRVMDLELPQHRHGFLQNCASCMSQNCAVRVFLAGNSLLVGESKASIAEIVNKRFLLGDYSPASNPDSATDSSIDEAAKAPIYPSIPVQREKIHLFLPDHPTTSGLTFMELKDARIRAVHDLIDTPDERTLTPVQRLGHFHFELSPVQMATLIMSPTASGKMRTAAAMIAFMLRDQKDTALFLVPSKTLADHTQRDLKWLFSGDNQGIAALETKRINIRHGSSGRKPITGTRILVATYDYAFELFEYSKSPEVIEFKRRLSIIVADEIHTKLRLVPRVEGCRDLDGVLALCRLIDVGQKVRSPGSKPAHLLLMSGTLGNEWRQRFVSADRIDILESEFTVNKIFEENRQGPAVLYGEVKMRIMRLIQFDPQNRSFSLQQNDAPEIARVFQQNPPSMPIKFLVIFGFQTILLSNLAKALRSRYGASVNIMNYASTIQDNTKYRIEKDLEALNHQYVNKQSMVPTILLTTTAIAEGIKLPGVLGINICMYNEKNDLWIPSRLTQDQQKARISRTVLWDRKSIGAIYYVTVAGSADQEVGNEPLETQLLQVARYGNDGYLPGTLHRGLARLEERFPGVVPMHKTEVIDAIDNLKSSGDLGEDTTITPEGLLRLSHSWLPPSDLSTTEKIWLAVYFNVTCLPFLESDNFTADFLPPSHRKPRLFKNRGDANHVNLVDRMMEGSENRNGRFDPLALRVIQQELYQRSPTIISRNEELIERIVAEFGANPAFKDIHERSAFGFRAMISHIVHGLIFVRYRSPKSTYVPGKRLSFQKCFYTETHKILDEVAWSQDATQSPAFWRFVRYFELKAAVANLPTAGGMKEAIALALMDSLETLKPGFERQISKSKKTIFISLKDKIETCGQQILEALR